MKKTSLFTLLTLTIYFQSTQAFDWDLAIRTALYSAIAPTLHVLMKAPKNQNTLRGIAAACCAISSVTSTYYAVLLERSNRTSDKFLGFAAACLGGCLGGVAHRLAEWTYTEYQNEKAWAKYYEECGKDQSEVLESGCGFAIGNEALHPFDNDQTIVTFGDDPQI